MEKILKELKKRGLKFELFYHSVESSPISFEQGELKALEVKKTEGIGLRIIKDGQVGFAHSNKIDDPEIIDFAISSSKFGKEATFDFPGESPIQEQDVYHEAEWDPRTLVNLGKEIISRLQSKFRGMKVDLEFSKVVSKTRILNSSGFDKEYRRTGYSYTISGFSVLKSGFTYVFDANSSTRPIKDFDVMLPRIEKMIERADKIAKIKPGVYPIILGPIAVWGTLVPTLRTGLNGVLVYKGMSPLTNKIETQLFGEKLSIVDDPENSDLIGSRPFDDEGVPTFKKYIVEKGVLKRHIHNLDSASKLGAKPEGNGIRSSFSSLPGPAFSNFIIEAGNRSVDEMIKSLKKGILVYMVIGGGQSNIMMGDYSVNIGLGYYIENGEIVGRVKNTMIAGNVYQDFLKIIDISRETLRIQNYILPYIVLEEVKVATE